MSNPFYKLTVSAVGKPIEEATTITFEVPDHLNEKFSFHPGQHLIVKLIVNGEEVRRSYSLNSCPFKDEPPQITVKRVKGGLVSSYINDQLKVGDELEVMTPKGKFYADVKEDAYKTYYLFAAGSGITPIISILESVLIASPYSAVHLFYGNSNQDTILFNESLNALQKSYSERLTIIHTLSDPKVWTSWKQWNGRKGRIDAEAVEWFITENPPVAQSTEYYICGPGAMNLSVRKTLMSLGIPKELIHIEQFGGEVENLNLTIDAIDNAKLSASLDGQNYNLNIPKGKTILQVLKEANVEPPYSCESGICGTCVARVIKGKAEMKSCMALEDSDISEGMILTCQALPVSERLEVHF